MRRQSARRAASPARARARRHLRSTPIRRTGMRSTRAIAKSTPSTRGNPRSWLGRIGRHPGAQTQASAADQGYAHPHPRRSMQRRQLHSLLAQGNKCALEEVLSAPHEASTAAAATQRSHGEGPGQHTVIEKQQENIHYKNLQRRWSRGSSGAQRSPLASQPSSPPATALRREALRHDPHILPVTGQ